MSSKDLAVAVRGLSKSYTIAHVESDATNGNGGAQSGKKPLLGATKETFWALKDVSFDVEKGDVMGIVGRNGAGKSTLLKILSQIAEPTAGEIRLYGRIGSLLEVGTGFHPELTGRENIFLNGAILGMSKGEIKRQFDAIVDFAEVEQFLDTPVKRYSSGMYVRLAFAVAAHLNPEIMIVDEVLAVGDASFQKKCLAKMQDVAKDGRTILFVSHNAAAIYQLCQKAVLLEGGQVTAQGDIADVMDKYVIAEQTPEQSVYNGVWKRRHPMPLERGIYFERISIVRSDGSVSTEIRADETFYVEVIAHATEEIAEAQIAIRFTNGEGIPIFTTAHTDSNLKNARVRPGRHHYRVEVPGNFLNRGRYTLIVASMIAEREIFDIVENEITLDIHQTSQDLLLLRDKRLGVITPILRWNEVVSPNGIQSDSS